MPDSIDPLNPMIRMPLSSGGAQTFSGRFTGIPGMSSDLSGIAPGAYDRPPPVSAPSGAVHVDPIGGVPVPVARRRAVVNPSGTRDLSVPLFSPSWSKRVPEFLQAIPMVKGYPIMGVGKGTGVAATSLMVKVQWPLGPTSVNFYDVGTPPEGVDGDLAEAFTFNVGRIGLTVDALQIDASVGVRGSSGNPLDQQVRSASVQTLRAIDHAIGRSGGSGAFADLFTLTEAGALNRNAASSGDIEEDARRALAEVCPSGGGAGEGPDCLIGSVYTLRALMATPSGQTGQSGWRRDPRTGLNIYHYMGIPFYRVGTDEASDTTMGALYAANLGVTGCCLVYAYGTADSYGLQVDENPFSSTTGMRQLLVHGAYSLVIWEPEAIFRITGTPNAAR